MGATKEERVERIEQVIDICHENGYTHLFAGYGFMAEDAEFVERIETAEISFIGPNSKVIQQAGSKDEAKQLVTFAKCFRYTWRRQNRCADFIA
jgi:Acetyl/propionyl-CoA carboxylase, alpha subunit